MKQADLLYTGGKAKSVYRTDDPEVYIMKFRDDITAFDGEKKDTLEGKGRYNAEVSTSSSGTWKSTGSGRITSRASSPASSPCGTSR